MPELWYHPVSGLPMRNVGGGPMYATQAALEACCCGGPPTCPASCCYCCHEYIVSWPSATIEVCVPYYSFYAKYIYYLLAGSEVLKFASGCVWNNLTLSPPASCHFHSEVWSLPGCTGELKSTASGNVSLAIGIHCTIGKWEAKVQADLDVLAIGTKNATATSCPNGSYTNSISVVNGSPCEPACCPTCTECPGPYTLTLAGLTGVSACKNGVPITLNAIGSPCSWATGTIVEACASCDGIPGVASWAAGITCTGSPVVYALTFYGNCLFGTQSWSFGLSKTDDSFCPVGTYTDGTVTAVVT